MKKKLYKNCFGIETEINVIDWSEVQFLKKNGLLIRKSEYQTFLPSNSGVDFYKIIDTDAYIVFYSNDALKFDNLDLLNEFLITIINFQNLKKNPISLYPIRKIEYLLSGKKIIYFDIGSFEGQIRANKCFVTDSFGKTHGKTIYILKNQSLIEHHSIFKTYFLFSNSIEYQEYLENIVQKKNYENAILGTDKQSYFEMSLLNTNRKPFLEQEEQHKNKLSDFLGIELPTLNFSIDSVNEIQDRFYLNKMNDTIKDELFLPLLYYLGEVINKYTSSKWVEIRVGKSEFIIHDIASQKDFLQLPQKIWKAFDVNSNFRINFHGIIENILKRNN